MYQKGGFLMRKETASMLMSGIIFTGMGFTAGFAVSELLGREAMQPVAAVTAVETSAPSPAIPSPAPTSDYYGVHYIVTAFDDSLILYEADGGSKKILRKSKINVNTFPPSDIADLKNGIKTGTLEGALEIWEGFSE